MKKITLFAGLLLAASTAFAAVPTSLAPVQDTYVDYSAQTTVKQGTGNLFVSYNALKVRDSYIKFSLADLVASDAKSISSVKLKLTAGYTSGDAASNFVINVRDVNFMDVDLNTLTWAGLSTTGLNAVPCYNDNTKITDFSKYPGEKETASIVGTYTGPVLVTSLTATGSPIEIDITTYVKWAVANGKTVLTLNLAKDVTADTGADWRCYFYTMEETTYPAGIASLNFTVSTGVNDVKKDNDWTVLPTVATNGEIKISNNNGSTAKINIYDLKGSVIKSIASASNLVLDTHDLSAGTYIVKIISEKEIENHRFVVVR